MRARLGVDALIGDAQPLYRPPANQMLRNNRFGIFGANIPIPNGIRINHYRRPVLALVEATGFVDPHLSPEPRIAAQLLQPRMQVAFPIRGA
jgi:hypothetical protein